MAARSMPQPSRLEPSGHPTLHVYSAAGASNVLGAVKFRFPNRHDIYMHDTPQRELFEKPVRAFSHGCMRVQNPGKLAKILWARTKAGRPSMCAI